MKAEKKLLIFGLDGATFDLLDEWFQQGELPFLKKLFTEGTSGGIQSTIPPVTGPAWASFQTGVNPGKHGIFDWGSSDPDSYAEGTVDSTSLKTRTIWQLASEAGRKVGVVGTPLTYPPRPVNGFVTTGVLTPNNAEDYTYPSQLKNEIEKTVDDYHFAPPHAEMAINTSHWIQQLKETIENKEKVAHQLLSSRSWDVGMVYFMETDTVLHHLFPKEFDDDPTKPAKINHEPALEVYRRVEEAVKRIYNTVTEPQTNVMVLSDHGFGPLKWIFNVNSWLLEEGYLQLKNSPSTRLKRLASGLGFNQKNLYKVGDLLGPLGKGNEWEMEGFDEILSKLFLSLQDIDWKNTKAYSRGGVTGAIRLNIKGRDPQGCLLPEEARQVQKELMQRLTEIENPYTGEPVVDKAMDNGDVYHGPSSSRGPDILFLTKNLETDTGGLTVFKTLNSIIPAFAVNGTHRMQGVFTAHGPDYDNRCPIEGLRIYDPAPNILHTLGVKVPSYMDGSLREEMFTPKFWQSNKPRIYETDLSDQKEPPTSADEQKEITERLKGLGYLA